MFPYYLIATFGALMSYVAEKCSSKYLKEFLYLLLIICFATVAGFRDLTVGTDTAGYGYASYRAARFYDFAGFYSDSPFAVWAPFAKIVVWTTSNLFNCINAPLVAIAALTVAPVVFAARIEVKGYTPLAILLFSVAFFPMSFNMMRQAISMSFLVLAYVLLKHKGVLSFVLSFACALLFHTSALFGLIIIPVVIFSKRKSFSGDLKYAAICAACVAFTIIAVPLIQSLSAATGLYSDYVVGSQHLDGGGGRTLITTYGVFLSLFLLGLFFTNRERRVSKIADVSLVALVTIGVILLSLSLWTLYFYRLGMTFLYFSVLLVPEAAKGIVDRQSRGFFIVAAILAVAAWSFDYYYLQLSHQVVPFSLSFTNFNL